MLCEWTATLELLIKEGVDELKFKLFEYTQCLWSEVLLQAFFEAKALGLESRKNPLCRWGRTFFNIKGVGVTAAKELAGFVWNTEFVDLFPHIR